MHTYIVYIYVMLARNFAQIFFFLLLLIQGTDIKITLD